MTTTLDTTLLEELTTSLAGCLATLELAAAVTTDESARRALEAVGLVISTSYEHLCRVDAMVFDKPEEVPTGPLVMGQEADACLHLDLTPIPTMCSERPQYMCSDCGAGVEAPDESITRHKDEAAEAELERVIAEHFPGKPVPHE